MNRLMAIAALGASLCATAGSAAHRPRLPRVVGTYACAQEISGAPPFTIVIQTQGKSNSHGRAKITGSVSGLVDQQPGAVAVRGFVYADNMRDGPDFYLDHAAPHYLLRVYGYMNADGSSFFGGYSVTQNNQLMITAQVGGQR